MAASHCSFQARTVIGRNMTIRCSVHEVDGSASPQNHTLYFASHIVLQVEVYRAFCSTKDCFILAMLAAAPPMFRCSALSTRLSKPKRLILVQGTFTPVPYNWFAKFCLMKMTVSTSQSTSIPHDTNAPCFHAPFLSHYSARLPTLSLAPHCSSSQIVHSIILEHST